MTHVKALQTGHSSQGTSEPITPAMYRLCQLCPDVSQSPFVTDRVPELARSVIHFPSTSLLFYILCPFPTVQFFQSWSWAPIVMVREINTTQYYTYIQIYFCRGTPRQKVRCKPFLRRDNVSVLWQQYHINKNIVSLLGSRPYYESISGYSRNYFCRPPPDIRSEPLLLGRLELSEPGYSRTIT